MTTQFEDSLKMSAYNVARDACLFSYNYCVVNSIIDRYSPQLIIWENDFDCLYERYEDSLEQLYPYYRSNIWVTQIIDEQLTWKERVMLNSRIYRYNSIVHRIVAHYFKGQSAIDTEKGYIPLTPKNLKNPLKLNNEEQLTFELSEKKIAHLRSVFQKTRARGIKLVMVDSPKYKIGNTNTLSRMKMKKICEEYDIIFLDNTQLAEINSHREYFNDNIHLNATGAAHYTKIFINQILQDNKVIN